jgi:hypothetical protein
MSADEPLPAEPRDPRAFGRAEREADRLPALRMPVRLAQALQRVRVPSSEMAGARARVEARVFARIPRGASRLAARQLKRRVGLAVALSAISSVVWLSTLAASALPSSPLYVVKRGEEWIAYQTAWSDGRRGEVLLLSASRRLEEVQTVAGEHEEAAVSLALDQRDNLMELVTLYQTMRVTRPASGETNSIKAGLALMLTKESDAATNVEVSGKRLLADTLRENVRLARETLAQRHLALP